MKIFLHVFSSSIPPSYRPSIIALLPPPSSLLLLPPPSSSSLLPPPSSSSLLPPPLTSLLQASTSPAREQEKLPRCDVPPRLSSPSEIPLQPLSQHTRLLLEHKGGGLGWDKLYGYVINMNSYGTVTPSSPNSSRSFHHRLDTTPKANALLPPFTLSCTAPTAPLPSSGATALLEQPSECKGRRSSNEEATAFPPSPPPPLSPPPLPSSLPLLPPPSSPLPSPLLLMLGVGQPHFHPHTITRSCRASQPSEPPRVPPIPHNSCFSSS